jgi:DNA-binding CsgD family transcriptional regulator
VIVIPVEAGDGTWPWLVHCAVDVHRSRRAEEYVERLAGRSEALRESEPPGHEALTKRETEILDLLAADHELGSISRVLGIRLATVRNHVQHVLAKLGAHSIPEAVALHLLEGE